MGLQRRHVGRGAIAFVSGKTILRVLLVHLAAPAVTVHLGQDGRRRNGLHQRIAFDDGLGRNIEGGNAVAIDSTITGFRRRPCTARRMASMVACRMLIWSISSTLAWAMEQHRALARISSNSFSRRASVSFFESARPAIGRRSSRMTAAATTGPTSGPRPASSTPATRPGGCQGKLTCSGSEDFFDRMGG